MNNQTPRQLKRLGMFLFLVGLITGFFIMNFTNPKMALAAHLEGVMNGTFLVVAGFIWNELLITERLRKILYGTILYGTFANWFFSLLSAVFGTSNTTPLSGAGYTGTPIQETLVTAGLASVGITMVFSLVVIVYGLRGKN